MDISSGRFMGWWVQTLVLMGKVFIHIFLHLFFQLSRSHACARRKLKLARAELPARAAVSNFCSGESSCNYKYILVQ